MERVACRAKPDAFRAVFRASALGLAALGLLAGCRTPRTPEKASVRQEIEAENRKLEELFRTGNLLGVADLYADEAELYDASGERTTGRDDIDAHWSSIESPVAWQLAVRSVRGSESLAYEVGTSRMTTREGGTLTTTVAEFLLLWRRGPDGTWQIVVDSSWIRPP